MLSKEAMEDLSNFIQMAEDEGLEYLAQLAIHVKQLQLEVTSLGQQLSDMRNGTRS